MNDEIDDVFQKDSKLNLFSPPVLFDNTKADIAINEIIDKFATEVKILLTVLELN